jgi:hypothetical protein
LYCLTEATEPASEHTFSVEREMTIVNYVQVFVHKIIISAVKIVEFVTDVMCTIIKGRCCDIIVLNVHASTEDKIDDMKDSFYDEFECVFDKFLKYYTKLLLG